MLYSVHNSSIIIQHSCENSMAVEQIWGRSALRPGLSPARLLYSASWWSALHYAGLLYSALARHLPCFSWAREKQSAVFTGKGKYALRARNEHGQNGLCLIWTDVHVSGPWWVHPPVDEGFESAKFDWPKRGHSALISQNRASILLVKIGFQQTFIRAGSDGRNTLLEDSSVQRQALQLRLLWSLVCTRDPCVEMATTLFVFIFVLNLSPVSHQEPFLARVFFFWGFIGGNLWGKGVGG